MHERNETSENAELPAEKAAEETNFGIVTEEEILREKSSPISAERAEELNIWNRLVEATLKTPNGIGLAAIQLGLPYSCAVLVDRRGENVIVHKLLNPRITKAKKPKWCQESCLSIPGKSFKTRRYMHIVIEHDLDEGAVEYTNVWAQAIQHEIGHFNGELVKDVAVHFDNKVAARHNRVAKSRIKRSQQKKSRKKNRSRK